MAHRLASILPVRCLFLALAAATAQANVKVVALAGGDFTTPQAAVDAAASGDIVLIRAGVYPTTLDVVGKSLTITADAGASVFIDGQVSVGGLSSTQFVTIQGVSVRYFYVASCAGSVRIVGCTNPLTLYTQVPVPAGGSQVISCSDVAFIGCDLNGVSVDSPAIYDPFPALLVTSSTVLLADTSVRGGDGGYGGYPAPARDGAAGIECTGSTLRFSGATCLGGAGGRGLDGQCPNFNPTNGGAGGAGVSSCGTTWTVLDSTLIGGAGGHGGTNACASAPDGAAGNPYQTCIAPVLVAGFHRTLTPITPAREGGALTLHFTGQPGDLVYAASNARTAWTDAPVLHGVLLIGTPYRRRFLGVADGGGSLTATIAVGELGAGVQGSALQMQLVAIDVAGEHWITGSSPAVRLDSSY